MSENNDYVVFEHVRKVYHVGEVDIEALADATFSVAKGELAIVVGESGAGKTTLLNILGGMDTLTSGKVLLDGKEISSLSMRELTKYRRYDIGFVFQFYNLVQNLTALENVSLATQICKDPLDPRETLKAVGLEEFPEEGSRNFLNAFDVELQIALRGLLPADVEDGEVCQVGHITNGGFPLGDGITVGDDDHIATA